MHRVFFYHWSTTIPFLYFAGILGASLFQKSCRLMNAILVCISLASLITWFSLSPSFPYSMNVWEATWSASENSKLPEEVKTMIPGEASLSIQSNLGAHFSQRKEIYVFPANSESVDYVLVRISNPYHGYFKEQNFQYALMLPVDEYNEAIRKLFNNPDYGVFYARNKYIIFKKGYRRDHNQTAMSSFKKDMEELRQSLEQLDK